jgi:hypothetical protein
MAGEITCPCCRRLLRARPEDEGAEMRCPVCDAVVTVPGRPEPLEALAASPSSQQGVRVAPADQPRSEAIGTDPTAVCPFCRRPLATEAVLCLECGFDRRTGRRRRPGRVPLRYSWAPGGTQRLHNLLALFLLILILAWIDSTPSYDLKWKVAALVTAALAVIILGSGNRLRLERDADGEVWLTNWRCFAFVPIYRWRIDVLEYDVVVFGYQHGQRAAPLFLLLGFLLFCVSPASVILMFRGGDVHTLALRAERVDDPAVVVYQEVDEWAMRELAEALKDAAGLRFER